MDAELLPYQLWRDDWVCGALVLCFLMFVCVANKTRKQVVVHARNFFYPPQEHKGLFVEETSFETLSVFLIFFQLSVLGGLMTYIYAQSSFGIGQSSVMPWQLLGIYVGCFFAYFLMRRSCTAFVNWVFFEKTRQKMWNEASFFLTTAECAVAFPLVTVFVYFDIPFHQTALFLLVLLVFEKILLTFKCYSIFFPKFYCLFHLFAYLCTLELMPLLALWKVLVCITDTVIIKY